MLLAVQGATLAAILGQGRATARANAEAVVGGVAESAAASVNRGFLAVDSALAGLPGLLAAAVPAAAPQGTAEMSPAARSAALSRVLSGLSDSSLGFRDLILLPATGGTPLAAALPGSRRRCCGATMPW